VVQVDVDADLHIYTDTRIFSTRFIYLQIISSYMGKVKRASVKYETEESLKQLLVYDLELVDIGEFQSNKFGENVDILIEEYERALEESNKSS